MKRSKSVQRRMFINAIFPRVIKRLLNKIIAGTLKIFYNSVLQLMHPYFKHKKHMQR